MFGKRGKYTHLQDSSLLLKGGEKKTGVDVVSRCAYRATARRGKHCGGKGGPPLGKAGQFWKGE